MKKLAVVLSALGLSFALATPGLAGGHKKDEMMEKVKMEKSDTVMKDEMKKDDAMAKDKMEKSDTMMKDEMKKDDAMAKDKMEKKTN